MRILILLVLFLQCAEGPKDDARPDLNILFVGNSLTYVNDLPSLVKQIAKLDDVNISYKTVAFPDFSLDDHMADGTMQATLDGEQFDLLIAQQGPSALQESQELLLASSLEFAKRCKARNTTFGLYMVWPSKQRSFDLDNSILSYTNAAKASNALLCPAGLAWKLAWEKDAKLPLYGPDQFHPGIHGSVLAAMTIYVAVKQKKDLDFIKKSEWKTISQGQLDIMKDAALRSVNGL